VKLRGTPAFASIAIAAVAVGLALLWTSALRGLELQTVDLRFQARGERQAPDDIAIVAVDEDTFGHLQQRWPFPRPLHGDVIDALRRDGARVIAYDVQFSEPSEDPREDRALADAVSRASNVLLVTEELTEDGDSPVFGGEAVVRDLGARSVWSRFPTDPGGLYRRPSFGRGKFDSLAVAAVEADRGVEPGPPRSNGAWIDYLGPAGSFDTVSFWRVAEGRFAPGTFRGKTVVVGATATSLGDVHGTPMSGDRGSLMSGPEIQANAIATARAGFPLRDAPGWLGAALVVAVGLVVPAASVAGSPRTAFLVAVVTGPLLLIGAQLAFQAGIVLPLVPPLATFLLAAVGSLVVHYVIVGIERLRIRDTFARFVPEEVVDRVLARAGEDLRLGGEELTCTVLFSDIRGFTTFSEQRDAHSVIVVLNRYLEEMSEAILAREGAIISYMGDGIMAVFGAPLPQPDHADRALDAALEMIGPRLDAFNEWSGAEGIEEEFAMGVGLNTGAVVAGNIGSDRRMDYTTIGDAVNTASRIEGMTKGRGTSILLAESTRAALLHPRDLVEVGEMPVRGRAEPVQLWTPAAGPEADRRSEG
jgi:adenylate cyclase